MSMSKSLPRPVKHLQAARTLYPSAWQRLDGFRSENGKSIPRWPASTLLPMRQWTEIVRDDSPQLNPMTVIADAMRLAAIATWSYTQGIYRIDTTLAQAISETSLTKLPTHILTKLPEWCIYIETPDYEWINGLQYGFWSFLDFNDGSYHLIIVIDSEEDLAPITVELGDWTLDEALSRTAEKWNKSENPVSVNTTTVLGELLPPLINLLLYVCSDGVEYRAQSKKPQNPKPKRTSKYGWRLFMVNHYNVWNIGDESGRVLREMSESRSEQGSKKRPHVRRAHWHGYWTGPRNSPERKFELRWLPPMVVAAPMEA